MTCDELFKTIEANKDTSVTVSDFCLFLCFLFLSVS